MNLGFTCKTIKLIGEIKEKIFEIYSSAKTNDKLEFIKLKKPLLSERSC